MQCSKHPEAEATDLCLECREPVCDQCSVKLSNKNFCKACLERKISHTTVKHGTRSKLLAFILSLVPGGGYFYLGLMKRGLQAIVLFFGTFFVSGLARIDELAAFVAPIMIFYSVFDTRQLLNRINQGEPVEDRELFDWGSWESKRNIIGAGLIVLGLFALLNNLAPYFINYHMVSKTVPPLLIIGTGIYILYKNTSGKGHEIGKNGSPES